MPGSQMSHQLLRRCRQHAQDTPADGVQIPVHPSLPLHKGGRRGEGGCETHGLPSPGTTRGLVFCPVHHTSRWKQTSTGRNWRTV